MIRPVHVPGRAAAAVGHTVSDPRGSRLKQVVTVTP
ncbi:hypothetical protein J2S53_000918 [Actinopolyspora lacussalsi]|nr:hypothetical protein [Actinopolyspora lacussalsi]